MPMPLQCAAFQVAPVVQLDRTPAYEAGSREFESLRARQNSNINPYVIGNSGKLSPNGPARKCAVSARVQSALLLVN
jgi:hypothetical protein